MEDRDLHKRIEKLVAEEHELEEGHIGSAPQRRRNNVCRRSERLSTSLGTFSGKGGHGASSTRTSQSQAPDHPR